jgi:hypothetical protein
MVSIIFLGFLVSFLGQLPLGNMSITATQICIQESLQNAWKYAIGVALIEMVYLRFALTGMEWVVAHKLLFQALGWLTVILFFVLGVLAFFSARKQQTHAKALVLNNSLNRFILGITMSALNPVQIPFWFLWTSILAQAHLLPISSMAYNAFTFGAGTGTIAGLAVYIYGGNWLVTKMKTSNQTLNKFMGIIFMLTAIFQLYRMLFMPWI